MKLVLRSLLVSTAAAMLLLSQFVSGQSEDDRQRVHVCGLVHDIGKMGLPPGLLEKPGSLTPDERRQMEEHSVIGERILTQVEGYEEIARVVRHHHEWIDGTGYPDGLAGEEIPLISRIVAVAEEYNVMTSDRPYRRAWTNENALAYIKEQSGKHFDPQIVDLFFRVIK